MSEVKKNRKLKLNKMEIVKNPVLDNIEEEEQEKIEQPKTRMIRGLTERQYNAEYMYRYKLVKARTTEQLLETKQNFLKKIEYIDEELKNRETQINSLKEVKKLKEIEVDMDNIKNIYQKLKSLFENE